MFSPWSPGDSWWNVSSLSVFSCHLADVEIHSFKMVFQPHGMILVAALVPVVLVPIWVNNELRYLLVPAYPVSIPPDDRPMRVSCYFGFLSRIVQKIFWTNILMRWWLIPNCGLQSTKQKKRSNASPTNNIWSILVFSGMISCSDYDENMYFYFFFFLTCLHSYLQLLWH